MQAKIVVKKAAMAVMSARFTLISRRSRTCFASLLLACLTAGTLLLATRSISLANAPACRYKVASGTVQDTETTLVWQLELSGLHSLNEASGVCSGLALDGGGWRVPTIQELNSLVDESREMPAVDTGVFTSAPAAPCWSSTAYAGGAGLGWVIDFGDGRVDTAAVSDLHFVRCVR